MPNQICQCGHGRAAHEHYRPGTECALCGPEVCQAYNGPRPSRWRSLLPKSRRAAKPSTPRDGGTAPTDLIRNDVTRHDVTPNDNVRPLIPKDRPAV